MGDSKDGPMYHVKHIRWPKRIKTNGGEMGLMCGIGISKTGAWAAGRQQITAITAYTSAMLIMS